jgi:dihydropteroate synthase
MRGVPDSRTRNGRNTTNRKSTPPRSLRLPGGVLVRFPAIMGVLNVTPDSFSDGGCFLDPGRALDHALEMEAAGASIIDVGGESTRPVGATQVSIDEEISRVAPVLERLQGKLQVPVSIDTRRAAVARIALNAGAYIINDVTALESDPELAGLAARSKCAVVLMHMRGKPHNHARFARYRDVVSEVRDYLVARARFAESAGIAHSKIILDPGLGFAKDAAHNFALLAALPSLCALGYPVLVGASRKRFVRSIAAGADREVTIAGAAVDALAIAAGASIVRVHDPAAAGAAVRMAVAVKQAAIQ